ncbi:MAG: hypothetical protein ACI8WB_005385 [Phenylobacterium sp.]|jgi:hypothetical protein
MNIEKWNFDGDARKVNYSELTLTSIYHPEETSGFSVMARVVDEPGGISHLEFEAKGHWAGNSKAIISSLRLYEKEDDKGLYLEDDNINFERRFGDIQGWVLRKWQIREMPDKVEENGQLFPEFKDQLFWYKMDNSEGPKITYWTWIGLAKTFATG